MTTIIVETGVGVASANSYISLEDAEQYLLTFSNNDGAIAGFNDELAAKCLVQACRTIDTLYGNKFYGLMQSPSNSLLWPRTSFIGNNGRLFAASVIPDCIKQAQAELALKIYNGEPAIPVSNTEAAVRSKSVSIDGAVSTSVTYATTPNVVEYAGMDVVERLLAPVVIKKTKRFIKL
jgi:hypothetical protein